MFAELVELGKRVRKGHDALKEEKCSWDIVIDKEGNLANYFGGMIDKETLQKAIDEVK